MQEFASNLLGNILVLHTDLTSRTYRHGLYHHFKISDPKPRDIHKASVRDRLVHHALYRQLYPFFDRTFTSDSYSCRRWKGTHKAMNTFRRYAYKESKNNTRTLWVLKCDIRKFFASIDQGVLMGIKHCNWEGASTREPHFTTSREHLYGRNSLIISRHVKSWERAQAVEDDSGKPAGKISWLFAQVAAYWAY